MNIPIFVRLLAVATLIFPSGSSAQDLSIKALNYEVEEGVRLASSIRASQTYIASMKILRPKANTSPAALAKINPNLPTLLNDFEKLIDTAEVSSRFGELYDRKITKLKRGEYLSEHNFLDCETALRLKHPETGRIALWVQGDMDVVTDGSDPLRSPSIEDYDLARTSNWYLPQTSYSWAKSGDTARNPFLDYYPNAIKELQEVRALVVKKKENDAGVIWREILRSIDDQIYRMKYRGMKQSTRNGLSGRRYLEATKDPFVVLPIPWVNKSAAWSPQIGDYAAVIYKNKIYPAILGDAGPTDKVGEASLKIARGINPKASGVERAVSDVSVTYLFFPRTASPRGAPDYTLWRKRVAELLDELGGISSPDVLHRWE